MEWNTITERIIAAAIEVHRHLGPGLLESIYESALCVEFEQLALKFENQKKIGVDYKGRRIGDYRIDFVVENSIVVELKSTEKHNPVFDAQILSYMRLGDYKLGLLINFNQRLLKDGIKRFIL